MGLLYTIQLGLRPQVAGWFLVVCGVHIVISMISMVSGRYLPPGVPSDVSVRGPNLLRGSRAWGARGPTTKRSPVLSTTPDYRPKQNLAKAGTHLSRKTPDGRVVEVMVDDSKLPVLIWQVQVPARPVPLLSRNTQLHQNQRAGSGPGAPPPGRTSTAAPRDRCRAAR